MPTREDQKGRVQQATDLVRLIGEQVALRPRGSEHVGLCPFHDDSTPSLYVSPAKQIYKCFSCGAGGDAFSFVINYHKMTFPEALRYLADRAGIEIETPTGADRARSDQRQRIADANDRALRFFRAQLKESPLGQTARDYLDQRGIHPDMVAAFQLGYAPDAWDTLAKEVARRQWDTQGFLAAGLIAERRRRGQGAEGPGGQVNEGAAASAQHSTPRPLGPSAPSDCYDRLRHRLIFPIFDAIGRPIAFGGRVLPGGTREDPTADAKYLNSPETALFNKSATLYGIHLAKKPIIDSRVAVIVEGYTDVIACHQAGATNVVATLGTALTAEHVRELRRYAEKVVLVFDADAAGQKAADRAVELFLAGELDVAIAVLPQADDGGGLDPADLLAREEGYQRWCELIEHAGDALSYQFQRIGEQLTEATSMTGRQHVAETYITRLAQLGLTRTGPIRRALVVQRLAELLHMSESAVNDLLSEATRRRAARRTPVAHGEPPATEAPSDAASIPDSRGDVAWEATPGTEAGRDADHDADAGAVAFDERQPKLKAVRTAERQLIGCLLRDNELFHRTLSDGRSLDEAVAPADLLSPQGKELYQRVYHHLSEGGTASLAPLLADLAAEQTPDQREQPDPAQARGSHASTLSALITEADAEVERVTGGNADRLAELCISAAEAILDYHRQQDHMITKREWDAIDDQHEKARQAQRLLETLRQPSPSRIARPPAS